MSETLEQAIASGDELRILYATRRIVASQLEDCQSGRDTASLSKQMQDLTARIATIEKQRGSSKKETALEKARKKAVKRGK